MFVRSFLCKYKKKYMKKSRDFPKSLHKLITIIIVVGFKVDDDVVVSCGRVSRGRNKSQQCPVNVRIMLVMVKTRRIAHEYSIKLIH